MVFPKAGFLYKVYQNPVSRSYNDTSKVDDPQQDYFTGEGIGDFVVNIDKVVTQLERGLKCDIRHRKSTAAKKKKRSAEEILSSGSQDSSKSQSRESQEL
mmetsp:Transcript_27201/g.41680  ORF Transcript_27201/g.41680 Transcript_27201/m.41680 type:complete len:100 (+) Transcript_27201:184-483(+)